MNQESILRTILICIIGIIYFIITFRYFVVFRKNVIFSGKIKAFHLIMIWLIPFIWIFLLKSLTKSTPGSYEMKNKTTYKPFSDNDNDALKASDTGF